MPNGKPDPKCPECKGTGQITLFTSSSECDCVNREPAFVGLIDKIENPYDGIDSERFCKKYYKIEHITSLPPLKQPVPPQPQKQRLTFDPDKIKKNVSRS